MNLSANPDASLTTYVASTSFQIALCLRVRTCKMGAIVAAEHAQCSAQGLAPGRSGDSSGYDYYSISEWWLSGLVNHLQARDTCSLMR